MNDTLLITNLTSSDDEINIVLEVIDLNNGCVASSSDTINSFNSSNYVAFDTSLDDSISLSGTEFGYDEELDGFYICSDVDSIVNVTFQNSFSNTEGIDSVIVYTNLNFTQTYYSSFDSFDVTMYNFASNNFTSSVNVTTYSGSCEPITVSYNILFNKKLTTLVESVEFCSSVLCSGDSLKLYMSPYVINMQPQATIEFNLLCQNNNDETIITWDYNDFQSNTYFTYNECSGDSGMYSVFKFSINETSCGCNPVIGSAPFPNKYFIQALHFGYCYVEGEVGDYDQLVLSEFIIPEDPNINILFPEDGCAPEEILLKITQIRVLFGMN